MKSVDVFYINPYLEKKKKTQTAGNYMQTLHVYQYFPWFGFFRNVFSIAILPHS